MLRVRQLWTVEVTARKHAPSRDGEAKTFLIKPSPPSPVVLACSIVTLLAHHHYCEKRKSLVRQAAWYVKRLPTFSDALATVRRQLWREVGFRTSCSETDNVKVDRALLERLTDALCYAA